MKRVRLSRRAPFGPLPVLPGEGRAGYDRVLQRISAAIVPDDVFEEMWVCDLARYVWERGRLLDAKFDRLKTCVVAKLQHLLRNVEGYSDLIDRWAAEDADAIAEVDRLLLELTGCDIAMLTAEAQFVDLFERLEPLERAIVIAESRRDSILRELQRHRGLLGPARWASANQIDGRALITNSKGESLDEQA